MADEKEIDFYAIGKCVLVEIEQVEKKTDGGIVLPDDFVDKEIMSVSCGKIINCGCLAFDHLYEKDRLKKGDYVYFRKYSGIGRKIGNKEYRVILDEDIYAYSKTRLEAI